MAKQILEHHCAKHLAQCDNSFAVQISLIAVKEEQVVSWEKVQSTIRSAIRPTVGSSSGSQERKLSKAIGVLMEETHGVKLTDTCWQSKLILSFFQHLLIEAKWSHFFCTTM